MRARIYVLVFIALAVTAISIASASLKRVATPVMQQTPAPGSIDEYVQAAKAKGLQEVTIPTMVQHLDVTGLDEATSDYTVLTARVVSKQSFAISPYNIETWYKFAVTETLSSKPLLQCAPYVCPAVGSPPSSLLPLNAGEILVPKVGGTVVREGVTINLDWGQFPDFVVGQTYLLFVDIDPATRVGLVRIGSVGAFMVDANDILTPVNRDDDSVEEDIATRHSNSLANLRSSLRAVPTPTPCRASSTTIWRCERYGGTWNDQACRCE